MAKLRLSFACWNYDGTRALAEAAIARQAQGAPAPGVREPRIAQAHLRSFEGIIPTTGNSRTLGVSEAERVLPETATP